MRPRWRGRLHTVGFVAFLAAGPVLVAHGPSAGDEAALSCYVACMLALFGVSALFHQAPLGPRGRRAMRRLDHTTIFLAIAGTYPAVAVLSLSGGARGLVLALVWGGALAGIVLRQARLDVPAWLVALPYVVVGWSALAVVPELGRGMSWPGFLVLLAGGLAYSAGAVVYARKRPDPSPAVFGFHEVFHALTLLGAGLQLVAIAYFALPRAGA